MTFELVLRLLNAMAGYVFILMAVKWGGMLKEYVMLLPASIILSAIVDFGRAESVTRFGLSYLSFIALRRAFVMITLACGLLVLLGGTFLYSEFQVKEIILALCVSGVLQSHIDIFLRGVMYHANRSIKVSGYQSIVSLTNLLIIGAAFLELIGERLCLWVLAFSPSLICFMYVLPLLRNNQMTDYVPRSSNFANMAIGAAVKAMPSGLYTIQLMIVKGVLPGFEVFVRAGFFIFGFFHIRIMARQEILHSNNFARFYVLFGCTFIAGMPLALAGDSLQGSATVVLGFSVLTCLTLAALWEFFVRGYKRYINVARV